MTVDDAAGSAAAATRSRVKNFNIWEKEDDGGCVFFLLSNLIFFPF